jgi:hypothetical protein
LTSRYAGLTNRAIAKILCLKSAGTVTCQLRTASEIMDKRRKTIDAIETELDRRMAELPDD